MREQVAPGFASFDAVLEEEGAAQVARLGHRCRINLADLSPQAALGSHGVYDVHALEDASAVSGEVALLDCRRISLVDDLTTYSSRDLHLLRRRLAYHLHPDRAPTALRDDYCRDLAIANARIDEALRQRRT